MYIINVLQVERLYFTKRNKMPFSEKIKVNEAAATENIVFLCSCTAFPYLLTKSQTNNKSKTTKKKKGFVANDRFISVLLICM